MTWYEDPAMPYFDNILKIPGFGFMQPTADYDVVFFYISKSPQSFSFDYFGIRVYLKFSVSQNKIEVQCYVPAEDTQEINPEDFEFSDYRYTLWLCEEAEALDINHKGDQSLKCSLFKPFESTLIKEGLKNPMIGFYASESR